MKSISASWKLECSRMFTLTRVRGNACVNGRCEKELGLKQKIAGHPGATMHNSEAIGQYQSGGSFHR